MKIINKIKKMCIQRKEIILYLIFGGLTTVINIITYMLIAKVFKIEQVISNIIAWGISVIFAYVVNKIFVFESKTKETKKIIKEMLQFVVARILSLLIFDIAIFAGMIYVFKINDGITKIITQVMIVVFNYVLSKFLIFRKKEK